MAKMNNIDLEEKYCILIKNIIQNTLPSNTKIWLFGSRAMRKAKLFSDIDLLIDTGSVLSLEQLSTLNHAFEESLLPYKVDLVDAQNVSTDFRKSIEQQLIPFIHVEY